MRELPPRMQDKLYHDMILPEETLEIRKKARLFAEKYIFPEGNKIAQQEEKRKRQYKY